MRSHEKQHTVDILFVLTLFCVLTLTSLLIVFIGSRIYSSSSETMDINFHNHVAMDYIIEKVHQTDGIVKVREIDNVDVLSIEENIQNKQYITYIYCDKGQLKEICIRKENSFHLGDGEVIMKVDKLTMEKQGNILNIFLSIEQKFHTFQISLRKGTIS